MQTAEDIVKEKDETIVSISQDETVLQACRNMAENKIGAILVRGNGAYIGIFTERDLLQNIDAPGFDPSADTVGSVMTAPIHTVAHSARLHKVSEMFLGLFVRHLLVEKQGEYIGLLSIGDLLRAILLEQDRRFKELNDFVNWDYFENWRTGRPGIR